jgi:hypothetical protein
MGFTPKTGETVTSSAAVTDCRSGFELETRNSATDHDDSGGGWSVGVGALRYLIPGADCRRSGASPVRQISPALRRMGSHRAGDTPIAGRSEASQRLTYGWRQSLREDLLKMPPVFGAVNLQRAGRPTLSQRTGA